MNIFEVAFVLGQLLTLVATAPTLLDPRAYIPRKTSGYIGTGLAIMTVALIGLGAPLGALATGLLVAAWSGVFILRGDRQRALHQ